MIDDDMILASKEAGAVRPDAFARLFATFLLAVVAATVSGLLLSRFKPDANSGLLQYGIPAIPFGVFAAFLMAQPAIAIIERHSIRKVLGYSIVGFILGSALRVFLLAPSEGEGAVILSYFAITLCVIAVWWLGRFVEFTMRSLGLPRPGDVIWKFIGAINSRRKRRKDLGRETEDRD